MTGKKKDASSSSLPETQSARDKIYADIVAAMNRVLKQNNMPPIRIPSTKRVPKPLPGTKTLEQYNAHLAMGLSEYYVDTQMGLDSVEGHRLMLARVAANIPHVKYIAERRTTITASPTVRKAAHQRLMRHRDVAGRTISLQTLIVFHIAQKMAGWLKKRCPQTLVTSTLRAKSLLVPKSHGGNNINTQTYPTTSVSVSRIQNALALRSAVTHHMLYKHLSANLVSKTQKNAASVLSAAMRVGMWIMFLFVEPANFVWSDAHGKSSSRTGRATKAQTADWKKLEALLRKNVGTAVYTSAIKQIISSSEVEYATKLLKKKH